MKGIKLGRRLRAVVDNVQGDALADIGCDHGKVTAASLIERRVQKAIACDISSPSLDKARQLAESLGIENAQFRCCDGFALVGDNEVDCAVVAGMGGNEIMNILSRMPKGIKRLILVAHRNSIELREYLSENGIYIDKDFVVCENGKFYDIIVAFAHSGKDCRLSAKELYLGKNSPDSEDYKAYVRYLQKKAERLAEYKDKSSQAALLKKMSELW